MEGYTAMKIINSKIKEKPMVEFKESDQQTSVVIMDKFTWKDILEWTKEYSKKQLEFPFK
jgi:hypothetical protein